MTLNTVVKGNPVAIAAVGYWLNRAKAGVDIASTTSYGAGTSSTSTWTGGAGDGFRTVMSKLGGVADSVATKTGATGAGLLTFAGQLQAVENRMATARQVAAAGGLTLTATSILPPGPAPQEPGALPPNATPAQTSAYNRTAAVAAAYVSKQKAYASAASIVADARNDERTAQLKLVFGPLKDLVAVTDLGVGATTGAAQMSSTFRLTQAKLDTLATMKARVANMAGPARRALKLQELADAAIEAERFRVATEGNLVARFGARQPQWVKTMLTKPVVGPPPAPRAIRVNPAPPSTPPTSTLTHLKNGAKALGRVPIAGLVLAGVGVGLDIADGTDPVKAIASGAAGVVGGVIGGAIGSSAGSAIGTSVGGPPGAVVGGVIGSVVGGVVVGSAASVAVEQAFG